MPILAVVYSTMKPMTRSELQVMAKEIEEAERIRTIKAIVETVYGYVVDVARNRNINPHAFGNIAAPTVSRWCVSNIQSRMDLQLDRDNRETFLKHNMEEILEKVRELFPDCDVSVKMLAAERTRDGSTEYKEVSPFSQYPAHSIDSYIVVDWT